MPNTVLLKKKKEKASKVFILIFKVFFFLFTYLIKKQTNKKHRTMMLCHGTRIITQKTTDIIHEGRATGIYILYCNH